MERMTARPKKAVRTPSCKLCGLVSTYMERVDAYCCLHCNTWLEGTCTPACKEFCAIRPFRPSQVPA